MYAIILSNGGTCSKFAEDETSNKEDKSAGQNDGNSEVISVVPPAQHNGIGTDSDTSDREEQVSISND